LSGHFNKECLEFGVKSGFHKRRRMAANKLLTGQSKSSIKSPKIGFQSIAELFITHFL
jgi:hypothetical protein